MNPFLFRRLSEAADDKGDGGGEGGDDTAATERKATEMGWSPKDKWRGNPDHWIDAPEFVKRGEQVMPILQANLRKEQQARQALEGKLQQTTNLLAAAQESINVLVNLNTKESRDRAKDKRRELLRAQVDARKDDNRELEVQLGEQIADVTRVINDAEDSVDDDEDGAPPPTARRKKGAKPNGQGQGQPPANDPVNDPAFISWKQDNPWFGTDNRKTAMATEIGRELRANNDRSQGREFFDKVSAEVEKMFAPHRAATPGGGNSRVEGGGGAGSGAGGGGGSGSRGKSYNDLPPDAKQACEHDSAWVVGEGRAFKDIAAWRKHYTEMYFKD